MIYTIRHNILKSLLSFLFIFSVPLFSIGGEMELPVAIERLENIVKDMDDDCKDKGSLEQLIHLFKDKDSITEDESKSIGIAYHSLGFECSEKDSYKTIITAILKKYDIDTSCKTIGDGKDEEQNLTYNKLIQDLINEYELLKEKYANKNSKQYGPNHESNLKVFNDLKIIFNECEVDTLIIDSLSNRIAIAGFGTMTNTFKTDLDNLIKQLKDGSLGVRIKSNAPIEAEASNIESEEIVDEEFEYKDWLIIILGSVFLVLVAFIVFKYFNSKKTSKDYKTGKKKGNEALREQEIEGLRIENRKLSSDNNNLRTEVLKLKERIIKLEKEKDEWQEQFRKPEILRPEPIIKSPSTSRKKTLYFATPNQRGEFTSVGEEVAKPYASSYKFYISHDGRSAEFEFFNQKSTFGSALDDPNRILPVCEPLNAYNPKASEIKTIRRGLVFKEGNKWVLKRKAEIKYV